MGKIHIKGGSDLKVMFTEGSTKLKNITLVGNGPWYTVENKGITIQANKRKKTPHVFRASGDMEVDFESTQAKKKSTQAKKKKKKT